MDRRAFLWWQVFNHTNWENDSSDKDGLKRRMGNESKDKMLSLKYHRFVMISIEFHFNACSTLKPCFLINKSKFMLSLLNRSWLVLRKYLCIFRHFKVFLYYLVTFGYKTVLTSTSDLTQILIPVLVRRVLKAKNF